jgi:hypothetical protein
MKKPLLGKICIVATLVFSLVYVPLSHQTTRASVPQEGHRKLAEPAQPHQHNLKASPERGIFTLHREGDSTVCKDATLEEMQALKETDANLPLHVLNPKNEAEIITNAVDGLTLTLRGTQQLEANQPAKAAFMQAANMWMSIIKSPITMIVDVDFGTTRFGTPYEEDVLGATSSQIIGSDDIYPVVRSSLVGGAVNAQQLAVLNAFTGTNVPTTLGNTASVAAPASVFRAMGIIEPNADPPNETNLGNVPKIGFNSAFKYDFDPSNGIDSDKIDFVGIALHEIGHALGFSSEVGFKELEPTTDIGVSTWDLFRFRPGISLATFPSAQRVLASGGTQVFFIGGQEIALATGRPDGTGGDTDQASHWKDDQGTGNYIGLMDPSARDGQLLTITQNDRDALEFFGHTLALPTALPGDTIPLASGVPQFNSIVAPSAQNDCTLSGLQFTIAVPAGTSQLKIDLNGIEDTDLFVRFGQRVTVGAQSTVIADFAGVTQLGSETLTITPSSAPALQAGTYFIAIANCGLSVTPFNITATLTAGGGGGTSPVVLRSAVFDPAAPILVLKTTGLVGPADLEVNGTVVTPPLRVKVKSEAKAKVSATSGELGLHAGANTIRLRINGLFTNSVTINQ